MKTKRNLLAATILAILLVSLTAPVIALSAFASEDEENDNLKIVQVDNWYKLESDLITVLFPRGGQKPMFIWWYTQAPDQIYVVKFKGLIEWFAFDNPILPKNPEYYNHLRNASYEIWRERFETMYFKPEENRWMGDMMRLMLLRQIVNQIMGRMSIETEWHSPFFPFDAGRWNLTKPSNITTPEGRIIGVSFAFKLDKVSDWMPGFKFAENNIMIRVRFYNTTVEETDPDTGYKYTVNAGEMKMDFVINKWVWNIDAIKEFIAALKANGFDVNIPEGKSRLALWVNLASINITKLQAAEEEPGQIEGYSTTTYMDVDGMHEDIRQNMTLTSQEKPIEINRPAIKLGFANETKTLGGFFQFVSSAKVKDFPNPGDAEMAPVKAAYIAAGAHMRLFIGYPYFGNGTLEHDPSIGVDDVPGVDTTPEYTVQNPSGINAIDPAVIGKYALPLFTLELAAVLVGAASIVAIIIYAVKWKKKTPINMVGAR